MFTLQKDFLERIKQLIAPKQLSYAGNVAYSCGNCSNSCTGKCTSNCKDSCGDICNFSEY